jgi:hypothetical protein
MLAKARCVHQVPGTDFGAPGAMLAIGCRDLGRGTRRCPEGRMLAKVSCVHHVPDTNFEVSGTIFGAPGDVLAMADANWGEALGGAWRGGC